MTFGSPLRRLRSHRLLSQKLLNLGALAVALALASCASEAPPPPPAPVPGVGLSPTIIGMASGYRGYITRATNLSPGFVDGASVAYAVRTGAGYEPQQLMRGAMAYGAVVALQDPAFVAGVRTYAKDPAQRRMIAYEILKEPSYVVGISGAHSAAGLVIAALDADATALIAQGKAIKQSAYDVQRQAWSKADVSGRDARLALVKQLSATPGPNDTLELSRLSLAVGGGGQSPLQIMGEPRTPPYSPLVIRSLAIGALAALGYANDDSLALVVPLMTDPAAASCLNLSKLNLYQCLAVSKPHYEDVFCLGQHVLIDTGVCSLRAAGLAVPAELIPKPMVIRSTPVEKPKTKAKAKATKKS